ncbi:MAG TPA: hypothetical protein VF334_08140 [Polyangia bacterium]
MATKIVMGLLAVSATAWAKPTTGIAFPKGTQLQASYADNSAPKWKPEEQVAYLLVWSIHSLEQRCHMELDRYCTLAELVKGVPGKDKRIIGLKVDPARDANYAYEISDLAGDYKTTATPKKPGLGGLLEDTGTMGGIYYDANGPATRKSKELTGNGWGVGPGGEGGDFKR